jgi:hypothetical protein
MLNKGDIIFRKNGKINPLILHFLLKSDALTVSNTKANSYISNSII